MRCLSLKIDLPLYRSFMVFSWVFPHEPEKKESECGQPERKPLQALVLSKKTSLPEKKRLYRSG